MELDDVLLRHCAAATVVTANDRLQRALRDAYDGYCMASGLPTSPADRITTLSAYLRARYDALRSKRQDPRELLTVDAQRLIWLECSPQSADFDAEGLYDAIADAWRIQNDWGLADALAQFNDNENHRLFRHWAETYRRKAAINGWLTEPELPTIVADAVRTREIAAEPLLMLGFDVIPPSLQSLIDASEAAGQSIRIHKPSRPSAWHIEALSAADPQQELRAAIHWARNLLAHTREAVSIGIVVPDLTDAHDQVARELDAILRPDEFEPDPATSPYNISGGIPLGSVPVVADALEFLDWLFEPLRYSRVVGILESPFFSLTTPAAKAEEASLPESYDASLFSTRVSASPLRDIVSRAGRVGLVDLQTATLELRALLAMAGWPNAPTLNGESFQAYQVFDALFDELRTHTHIVEPRHISTMVRHIRRAADRRIFAAQRPRASLQILGYLETVGLEFTHLWVTGLDHVHWPATPRPNPFVPLRFLRSAGVTRADNEGEIAFARRMTNHWQHAARSVVFSCARLRDDAPGRLSSLVEELRGNAPAAEHAATYPAHPYLAQGFALVDSAEVSPGPVQIDRLRHRGTGILRDQSACPFRAFARYRLHAIQQTPPHSYPDATDRGVATHAALREVFERLQPNLNAADPGAFEHAIQAGAARALETYRPIPAAFRSSEQRRITNLLRQWIDLERTRTPFQIVANERATTLSLAGIEFQLRIDRIDHIGATGELLVIDYKTGVTSGNVFFGDRPEEPQLPMYALSEPNTRSIAFAQIRRDECRLIGWSEQMPSSAGIRFNPPPAEHGGRWEDLSQAWNTTLTKLADDFRGGAARVDPRDAKACRECNLHSLCRIREIRQFVSE